MIVNVFTLILDKDDCKHGFLKNPSCRKKLIQNDYLPVATNYNFLNSNFLPCKPWNGKLRILDLTDFIVSNIKVLLNHVENLEYWI